jgi:hypothetical protein
MSKQWLLPQYKEFLDKEAFAAYGQINKDGDKFFIPSLKLNIFKHKKLSEIRF